MKKEADHKNLQLDIVKKNHALSEKEYETLNAKIAPIDEKIKKIAEAEHKVIQLNTERFKIVESLKLKKEQQAALRRDIKQIYEGSTEQLKSDLESFKMKMEDNQTKQRDIEKEYFLISNKIDKMQADITKNEGDSKKLIYQREQEQEWNDDRGKKVKELCEKLKISCPQDSESLENVDPIMANVNRQVAKEEKDLDQMKRSYDEEMQKMQENSDKLLEKKASLESRVSAKRNQIKELDQESEKLKKDIGVGESSMSVLNSLITTIESSEKSLEEYTQSSNLGAIRATEVEEKKKRVVLQVIR